MKIKSPYIDQEPLETLPKQRKDKPLNLIQLVTLWFVWSSGAMVGLLMFLIELLSGVRDRHKQGKVQVPSMIGVIKRKKKRNTEERRSPPTMYLE